MLSSLPIFGQQLQKPFEVIFNNVDSSYFTEDGSRMHEFTMPLHRAFDVMDMFEAMQCETCHVIKGHRNYIKYLKQNYPHRQNKKLDKGVFGHLDCIVDGYLVMMWMDKDYAFGMITSIE